MFDTQQCDVSYRSDFYLPYIFWHCKYDLSPSLPSRRLCIRISLLEQIVAILTSKRVSSLICKSANVLCLSSHLTPFTKGSLPFYAIDHHSQ